MDLVLSRSLRLVAALEIAAYAALPLLVVGGIVAGLIASGVLPGGPSGGTNGLRSALLLGPVGVVVTRSGSARLVSPDGAVSVSVEEGSVSTPIRLRYRQRRRDISPPPPASYDSTKNQQRVAAAALFDMQVSAGDVDSFLGPCRGGGGHCLILSGQLKTRVMSECRVALGTLIVDQTVWRVKRRA